jgi:hypothetical protein
MMDLVIMRSHMPVRGIVTAEGYAASLASPQVQPSAMYFHAFFANMLFCSFDGCDRAQVLTYMAVLTHSLKLRVSGINPGG